MNGAANGSGSITWRPAGVSPADPWRAAGVSSGDPWRTAGVSHGDPWRTAGAGAIVRRIMRARQLSWATIWIVWSVPALADIADTWVSHRLHGTPRPLWRTFVLVAPGWYLWALLTPLILRLSRRVRLSALGVHVAASVAAGCIDAAVNTIAWQLFRPPAMPPDRYVDVLTDWLPIAMVIYWAIVAVGHALDNFRRVSDLSAELARAQLSALRAQLHPHFLFNTLNAAAALVRTSEPEAGARVLTHLSEILRHLLGDGAAREIPLRDELALLDRYLEIERTRFGARLTAVMATPDGLGDALVPSLVLQPLVENAVRHGVARRDAPVHVTIDVFATSDRLHLRVTDDGPGLPPDWSINQATGVGLGNTRARLAALSGDDGTLDVRAPDSGGVQADITLPLHRVATT